MFRKLIRIAIYLLLAGIVTVLVGMYVLYRHTPAWYRPMHLSQEQLQKASGLLAQDVADFQSQASENPPGKAITIELDQALVNSYLQALAVWDPRAKLPADVVDPVIVFQKDRLILACRYPKVTARPISLHLGLRVEPDKVAVSIESIQVGSLPLPQQFVSDQLAELRNRLDRVAARIQPHKNSARELNAAVLIGLGQAFFKAIAGEPMPREFHAPGSQRLIRVERVELTSGKLTLTFTPLGEAFADPFERMYRRPTTRPDSD